MPKNIENHNKPSSEKSLINETLLDGNRPLPAPRNGHPIAHTVERYLASIRGIALTASIALPHIAKWTISEIEKTQKKIERFIPESLDKDQELTTFTLESARDFAEFTSTIRQLDELRNQKSTEILAKSLFTQLFAEFDSYTGELLKVIYLKNDKLLKGISREISLSDLMDFQDLASAKISMLDKEIETFRRDSYAEQFATLEKKFNLPLRKFKEWPDFVELSQRRNILIHNGGMISNQYISVCEREGYKFDTPQKIGDSIDVTFEYFLNASRILSKTGLMLAYTLWGKIFPKESELIHSALNDTIFHCLQQKRWRFVGDLEDFVLSEPMKKDITEIDLRIRIVNASIGLKFSGRDQDASKLLDSVDWSASYRDFRLATAVLHEKYDDAVEIMKSIGKTGEIIQQADYHTWPLFTKFRERPDFYQAYFEIYGEAFAEKVDTTTGTLEAHAKARTTRAPQPAKAGAVDATPREIISSGEEKKVPSKTKSPVKKAGQRSKNSRP